MALSLFVFPANAASDKAKAAVDELHELGLFGGVGTNADGSINYDLDRAPSRAEGVTMLVRMLGKEDEAKADTWTTPFSDVADWAKPYVGYAYTNGLTNGVGDDGKGGQLFGSNATINATQYLTFVLRSLGYESGKDFQWDKAWTLTDQLGITAGEYGADSSFTRGDITLISVNALSASLKGGSVTLAQSLGKTLPEPMTLSLDALQGLWALEGNGREGLIGRKVLIEGSDLYWITETTMPENGYKNYEYRCGVFVGTISQEGDRLAGALEYYEEPYFNSTDFAIVNRWSVSQTFEFSLRGSTPVVTMHDDGDFSYPMTPVAPSLYVDAIRPHLSEFRQTAYDYLVKVTREKGTLTDGVYKYGFENVISGRTSTNNRGTGLTSFVLEYDPAKDRLDLVEKYYHYSGGWSTRVVLTLDREASGRYQVFYDSSYGGENDGATAIIDTSTFLGNAQDLTFVGTPATNPVPYTMATGVKNSLRHLEETVMHGTGYTLSWFGFSYKI